MVDKTSVQRRIFGCNCAAQYFSQKQLKESRKTTLLRAQYDFLGLVFSGSQSLVIKGGSPTRPTPIVWMSVTTRLGGLVATGRLSPRIVSKEEHGLVLHLLSHLVGVEDARHRHLHFSLLLLGGLQGGLPLLKVQISVIFPSKLPDLY